MTKVKVSVEIFSDGGARGNPGPAASAFVVMRDGKIIHKQSKYLGKTTNNVAEYGAVVIALEWLLKSEHDIDLVNYYVDSELVCKQLNGEYKIKSPHLLKLVLKIKAMEKKFDGIIDYHFVRRDKNKLADYLVNKSLDENI